MRKDSPVASQSTGRQQNIEVWNDLVAPKDLLICLAIAVIFAAAAVPISQAIGGNTLFWGLAASILGFTVNCFLVSPKRNVSIIDEMNSGDAQGDAAGSDIA